MIPTPGTFGLIGLLVGAALLSPLYWRFVPVSRRREFHIALAVLVVAAFFPRQIPALALALGWTITAVHALRRRYDAGAKAHAEKLAAAAPPAPGSAPRPPAPPPTLPSWMPWAYAAPLLLLFLGIKAPDVFRWVLPVHPALEVIGYSYFILKALHLLIEAARLRKMELATADLLQYFLYLPAFFSGPIDRFDRFRKSMLAGPTREDRLEGFWRLGVGLVRKFILADGFHLIYRSLVADVPGPAPGAGELWLRYNLFLLYLYSDFGGYSDIAVGLSRLYGWKLCENFDSPLTKGNLVGFWRSWHMSLTQWLTDYVFTPVARWFTLKLPGSPQTKVLVSMVPASMLSMVFCGLWHEVAWRMVFWGLLHGLGMLVANFYVAGWKSAGHEASHAKLAAHPVYRTVCCVLVAEFIVLSFPFVLVDSPETLETVVRTMLWLGTDKS